MKKKLKIIKEYAFSEKGGKLLVGTEFEKFSLSNDLFENKINYLIKLNNSPLLIPGEYAEVIDKNNHK
jgi:hypothetical protein